MRLFHNESDFCCGILFDIIKAATTERSKTDNLLATKPK